MEHLDTVIEKISKTLPGLDKGELEYLQKFINPEDIWLYLSQNILSKDISFECQEEIFHSIYPNHLYPDPHNRLISRPSEETIYTANLTTIRNRENIKSTKKFHNWSTQKPEAFWASTTKVLGIPFKEMGSKTLDLSKGPESPIWFPKASMNIVDACFQDIEETQKKQKTAILIQEPDQKIKKISYGELYLLTTRVADSLHQIGISKGDKIAIYMPMTYEAIAIYLGIIYCGAIAVPIADSFSSLEISARLKITKPKYIFLYHEFSRLHKTIDYYEKIKEAKAPPAILLSQSNTIKVQRDTDLIWEDFLQATNQKISSPCSPQDHSTILFSSGTTGEPKGIPWDHTSPIKCASDAFYHQNIKEDDILCWPTNLGWMMGPWLVYAALINDASIALYYDAPTDKNFGKFVQDAHVTMLGTIPSIVKTWKTQKCMEAFDWGNIKIFSSTGEASNPEDIFYLSYLANYKPVIEYCGGTEIAGAYISNTCLDDFYPSVFSTPAMGLDFYLYEENQQSQKGEVFLRPPSIGLSNELINKDHHATYYKNTPSIESGLHLRRHGDIIEKIDLGYRAHGRSDDSMNLGGIKVSSIQIEEVLNTNKHIKESAAVAISPKGGGPSSLVLFVVLNKTHLKQEEIQREAQEQIKKKLNPLFKLSDLIIKENLPRTASNKVMRKVLRKEYLA